ncbi:MAG: protoporphyrinogen oxidase [Sphingobacteriales bacterium]|jgi:protoporphyrinogen oxidase
MIKQLTILGGGPAGVTAAYFAQKNGLDFSLVERNKDLGGNARTFTIGEFRFDTGAHRVHDKIPEVTQLLKSLLGEDLKEIEVPSYISIGDNFLDFPLSPGNLLKNMSVPNILKSLGSFLFRKAIPVKGGDFSAKAINAYGDVIAQNLLLSYSQKLWGLPCEKLDPIVAGSRLKGLDFKSLIFDFLGKDKSRTRHLDGSFFYPTFGIGMIKDAFENTFDKASVSTDSEVTEIRHDGKNITKIVSSKGEFESEQYLNTLPLNLVIRLLNPQPPQEIIDLAKEISFRSLTLVVILLDKESVTPAASIYFPDPDIPFTRVVEPRNRSRFMAPEGKTSLVVEVPHFEPTKNYEKETIDILIERGLFARENVIETKQFTLPNAYPVLQLGAEEKVNALVDYLSRFKNLKQSGRNALFSYGHLHNMIIDAKNTVTKLF